MRRATSLGITFLCLILSPAILLADLLPPEPNIARHPMYRLPTYGSAIAVALLLTAIISAIGIWFSKKLSQGTVRPAVRVALVLVWLLAVGYVLYEGRRADREWRKWDDRASKRHRDGSEWYPSPPTVVPETEPVSP